ncbi:MAG: hypothetical protein IT223_07855 [Crocinitomicaceae bacterium]|nr:hypothetical protein [Crocinitomicaceae bacterium]
MKKKSWIIPIGVALVSTTLFIACEDSNTSNKNNVPAVQTGGKDSVELAKMAQLQKIFFSIPAPMEMASLIKQMGYKYDGKLLNSTESVTRYTGETKQAVNLGIFGADLSYASMFDEKQESMNYLAAAQKLAREMGVDGALQDQIIERLNNNQQSRDSLLNIVSEAYGDLNGYLKENNRVEISALVIAGGWMEALYLSTRFAATGNETLKARIAEQKYSLDNLLKYFAEFNGKENLAEMNNDLKELKILFDAVQISSSSTEVKKEKDGMVVIGNSSSVTMSDESLKNIATKIQGIRSKYIA